MTHGKPLQKSTYFSNVLQRFQNPQDNFSHSPARWTPCRGECPILFGGAVSDHHRMTFVRWEFIWHKDLSQVWSLRLQRLNGHSNLLDPTNGSGLYGLAWPDSWSLLLLLPYKKAEETAEQMGVYGVSQSCDASQMRIVSWFCLENASRLMTSVWQITSLVFVCTSDSCRCITFPFWLLPGCSIFCITACGWHSARISFEEAESAEQAGHHVFMFLPKNLNQKMLCILALPVPFEAGAEA